MKGVAKPFPKIVKSSPNKANTFMDLAYDKKIGNEFGVLFVGDTSFAENYVSEYASRKNIGVNVLEHYGRDYFFEKVKPILLESDLVIANLETPLIDVKNTKKPVFSFSSRYRNKQGRFQHWSDKVKTVEYLKKYNILNVSLANNHMLDYGIDGLNQTLDILKESGIRFFGAGVNRRQASTPYTKNIFIGRSMVKLVVFSAFEYRKGYDVDFSFYAKDRKGGVNRLSINKIYRKIKKIREEQNNVFIVASPHWGGARNYGWKTNKQTNVGHQLVDAGVDIVIAHGPHNVQQIEEYNGKLILYSIGNFVYNSMGNYNSYNAIPFGLTVKLLFKISDRDYPTTHNRQNNANANDDAHFDEIKKTIKIYPIMTDNHDTKFQARLLGEQEFKIVRDLLIDKYSLLQSLKRKAKIGMDKIGHYIELDLP